MNNLYDNPIYKAALDKTVAFLTQELSNMSELQNKNILVTGATGQLGSAFINLLTRLNETSKLNLNIIAAVHNQDSFKKRFSDTVKQKVSPVSYEAKVPFIYQNSIDYIVHCAGYGDPKAFVDDPVGVMHANIYGLDQLLSFLVKQKRGKLLFISSGEVYGQAASGVSSFNEAYSGYIDTMNYRSCYPLAKMAGETLCTSYVKQHKTDVVVARQCHVFGPSYTERDSRVTAEFLNCAKRNQPIIMKSQGLQVRSYIHELDAVCAYIFLLLKGTAGSAYNVAPSYHTSIKNFATLIANLANVSLKIEAPSSNQQGYANIAKSVLDAERLNQVGWKESLDLHEALDSTIKTLRFGKC